jgi:SAM-dependent methyltransferase
MLMTTRSDKLHLGCFDQILPGWVNTDITLHIFISKIPGLAFLLFKIGVISEQRYLQHRDSIFKSAEYLNLRKRFPYQDESFGYVFMGHVLEHLYPNEAIYCLREVHRVLKNGGTVRISVPDLDRIVRDYDPSSTEVFLDSILESKQKRDKNRHHWHYNESSLRKILGEVGFRESHRCGYREGRCPDLNLTDIRPDSLFVESIR